MSHVILFGLGKQEQVMLSTSTETTKPYKGTQYITCVNYEYYLSRKQLLVQSNDVAGTGFILF